MRALPGGAGHDNLAVLEVRRKEVWELYGEAVGGWRDGEDGYCRNIDENQLGKERFRDVESRRACCYDCVFTGRYNQ